MLPWLMLKLNMMNVKIFKCQILVHSVSLILPDLSREWKLRVSQWLWVKYLGNLVILN